jgi:hypothetical protein
MAATAESLQREVCIVFSLCALPHENEYNVIFMQISDCALGPKGRRTSSVVPGPLSWDNAKGLRYSGLNWLTTACWCAQMWRLGVFLQLTSQQSKALTCAELLAGKESITAFEELVGNAAGRAMACCVCGAEGSASASSSASDDEADEDDDSGPNLFFTVISGLDFQSRSVVLQRAGVRQSSK